MNTSRLNTQLDLITDFSGQRKFEAEETIKFLQAHKMKFWSWGADGFLTLNENAEARALRFKVRGRHHKGYVYISINSVDTFDVVMTNNRQRIVFIENDIYIDSLFDILDARIEKKASYTR